jgi:hypothetical protein
VPTFSTFLRIAAAAFLVFPVGLFGCRPAGDEPAPPPSTVATDEEATAAPGPEAAVDTAQRPDVAAFARFSADELAPYVLGEKYLTDAQLGEEDRWCDQQEAAAAWFMYRTRQQPDKREALAQRIAQQIIDGYDVHEYLGQPTLLGYLNAHKQLVVLLSREPDLECCFYQETLDALWDCATPADVPRLIELIRYEEAVDMPLIRELLGQITGVEDAEEMDEDAWRQWWQDQPAAR